MEDMAKYAWLALRGRTYYLRAPVPLDNADRVQGFGRCLRNSQAQALPRRTWGIQ